ncbi:hypothetical protein QLH51_14205 [Sphingomonas sp. 2R-10]|uniref:hypothetical protein n=1 Tax=Sphingomonas sp. 2R-10 TaxID=3045148 RepID=UPI000F7B8D53|nr:hypothetical protein [Sphingomonas sp. 2R-10]MDJ0277951.1 hypothetical protein [Sphingomonas sp. 2R-10]
MIEPKSGGYGIADPGRLSPGDRCHPSNAMFSLDPALDLDALADTYRRDGHVVIDSPVSGEDALLLAAHLRREATGASWC